jgi:serine kinase of HPr protein (carbohydrate metabolism regulator)
MTAIIAKPFYVHATALIVNEQGILIRGPSRSGKSSLALELLHHVPTAEMIGDDRVSLEREGDTAGRIILRGHPLILGKIEQRGVGILDVGFAASGVARLVLDLQGAHETEGEDETSRFRYANLCGILVPAYRLPWRMDRLGFVLDRLAGMASER